MTILRKEQSSLLPDTDETHAISIEIEAPDKTNFESIKQALIDQNIDDTLLGLFIERYPQWRFIACDDDDVSVSEPYFETPKFALYLMANQLGCACFTQKLETSVGFVIGVKYE